MVELNQVETQSVEPPVPWKSNLSSYSSKADTSSRYSSRDDVGSDGKAAPRFGSLSTPSTYRPSYSVVSGSYRSVPIKKEPPVPTYTSRYSTSTTSTKDSKEQDKDSPTIKKTPSRYDSKESISKYGSKDVPSSISTTSKYSSSKEVPSKYGSTKDLGSLSTSKYGSSKESSSKYGSHKELPTTKYGSTKDISSSASDPKSSRYNSLSSGRPKKDEGPPITYNTRYSSKTTGTKDRSRDPSPAITDNKRGSTENKRTPITLSGVRSRDPSPAAESKISIITARIRSRDPSPVSTDNKLSVFNSKIKSRDPSPIDSKRSSSVVSRIRSRDPSPAIDSRLGTYSSLRARSRDPSPVDTGSSYLRRSSRDPSPADTQRDRFGSTNNGYSSSYRPYSRSNTTGTYTSPKYGSNTSIPRSAAVDKALSYLSASESRSRSASVSRSSSQVEKVEKKEKVQKIEEPKIPPKKVEEIAIIETEKAVVESSSEETDEESSEESEPPIMVELVVCTRGTSPTPPSSSNFLRARRADLAKTIEKTVKRPQKRPPSVDKEIQSDRGDDSTRYLRYTGSRSSLQPWSSYLDSKYSSPTYSRYGSSSSPRYSRDSTSRSDKDRSESKSQTTDSEKKDEKPKEKSLSRSGSLIRSGSNKNLSVKSSTPKLEKSKSSPNESKSKSPPKSSSSSKPKSPDNSKSLPPMAPKAESPTKSTSSSGCLKWTNKDFRKSALNMGTSDRPRKVRTNSGTDTDIPNESSKTNSSLRSERSPSAGSEASNSSTTSSLEEDSKLNKTKASSRTSLLASSADELPMDKPTQSPNSLKLTESSRNDEAKSFLIRALGPVTNFFKSRSHESSDNKNWLDTNSATSISESLQQDTEPLRDLNSHNETDMRYDTNQNQPIDKALDMKYKLRHIDSGDRAWWLNSSEDLTGSSHREEKTTSTNHETSPRIVNNMSEKKCPEIVRINLNRIESGSEKSWWGGANSNEGSENTKSENHENKTKTSSVPSGEKSWWLSSPEQESSSKSNLNSVSNSDKNKYSVKPAKSGERAWWMLDDAAIRKQQEKGNGNSDSDSEEIIEAENKTNSKVNTDFEIPTTLGRRRSPEGVEDTSGRLSPYDNILTPQSNNKSKSKALTLFISRHTNIDEILGATQNFSMDSLSPLLIHPDQVRIHDSTSQMAVIQRAVDDRDELDFTITSHQTKPILDDAALQVYKDGDYGAYLDLESSLAEQSEEIEGLHSSRKNSLVVRTQLSVRVHAIIEKLLTSEGRELRRALFSLKQIFQEDKDLVHGFVALGGLNCLVRVGSGADQNYQNYILRALGQVMLYVDGMNGVMKHGPTIQWLYSLIASKYRLVVKTALKLLLVFVEYVENNCYLLVNAIHAVDTARGAQPWTNIMKLLKDYENADTELLIYATSLINKTLSGLSDQDSFYDESDYLEQQGMESVVQRYMSRPGTDLDLLDQLQLYEAVLKFEDGESDGIRIPDTSIRKTLRYRANGTDSTERRKSRRHSTGTAPLTPPPMPPTPQGYNSSTQQTLDEDSSSSQNSSTELNGVLKECRDKTPRDGAGVTPGLRRRRERAERQKSFIREQQEAAAAGLRPTFAPEETNGHGHYKTAVPIRLQNGNENNQSMNNNIIISNNNNINNHNNNINNHSNHSNNINNNNNNNLNNIVNNHHGSNRSYQNKIITTTTATTSTITPTTTTTATTIKATTIPLVTTTIPTIIPQIQNNGIKVTKITTSDDLLEKKQSDFINNKTILIKNGKINGYLKQNNKELLPEINGINNNNIINNNNNNNNISYNSHKQFENETNRINQYYNQLNGKNLYNQKLLLTQNNNSNHNNNHHNNNNNNLNNHNNDKIQSHVPIITTQQQIQTQQSTQTLLLNNVVNYTNGITNGVQHQLNGSTNIVNCNPSVVSNGINGHITTTSQPSSTTTTIVPTVTTPITNGNGLTTPDKNQVESDNEEKKLLLQLKRDHTVKDLTQKLSNLPMSPQEDKPQKLIEDMTGLISKAKEGLAKSKSKGEISRSPSVDQEIKKPAEPKKSENELHWEELIKNITRPLKLCDLDFTDLSPDDEKDVLAPRGLGGMVPPPPPPIGMPPPMSGIIPPPINMMPPPCKPCPPPMYNPLLNGSMNTNGEINGSTIKKNKKTVKLFWKEVREDMIPVSVGRTVWDELPETQVDTQKLEHLFESRAKDLMTKKQQELNKNKEIIVLDHKRSNAINIAMTKLPPPRAIKAAILKMDATVVTREGIDKLLNMLPTDEERGKIQEAQMLNPELPLGSAENFLLTLSSISELGARLKLWAFKLDFENIEKEIAEPLMDLKQGLELLKANKTFKCILSTLLSIGIFLNGAPVKGFQVEYLAKVPEVKDTVHKHSLLHHLCHMVMETSTDTTDLYSEIGPITRASKSDFGELAHNIVYLETECKASWDRLKLISKHDCPPQLKQKMVDFLADCAERIIILDIVHRRVVNRYRKFLLWLGIPLHRVPESRPNEFCRIISEFALEYRTTRERVHQQIEKKANHRERNKTRGKMIIDVGKFKSQEDNADAELRQLLGTPNTGTNTPDTCGTFTWRRRRAENLRTTGGIINRDESFTDGDDEILESLVKTATKTAGPRPTPRERKRTRHADRKSLKRSRTREGFTIEPNGATPEL